jgi:hypothetical protein
MKHKNIHVSEDSYNFKNLTRIWLLALNYKTQTLAKNSKLNESQVFFLSYGYAT